MATSTTATANPVTSGKLEDQAAAAALYVAKYDRDAKKPEPKKPQSQFLDSNNKLSSAGAAASLKYANPRDLPSFPSSGMKDLSAAGAAASSGWNNQKSTEYWKPEPSDSAAAAAMLAKDYRAPPLWQHEQSVNSAMAAMLAAKKGGNVDIWKPEASKAGNSAATLAMKTNQGKTYSPQLDYGYTDLGRQGSLLAATGALAGQTGGRKRASSNPVPKEKYPDEANAKANALKAAMSVHKTSQKPRESPVGGANPVVNMPKEMFTYHPPVQPEVDERTRADVLHASAVAMAKQMYQIQQRQINQAATHAAVSAHNHQRTSSSIDEKEPMRFTSLQAAAQKLAQERLAKLHDEHAQNREYRDYYSSQSEAATPRSRLSFRGPARGRARRRASSEGSMDEDVQQSQKIRQQMSMFSSNLTQVDEKKRQQDREALLAAAQRNVRASLHGMDERVFADTGKVAPSLWNEWELKAQQAAQAKSESRMENHGKVNIGGGKFMEQSAIDLVAARNVQPVLDELNEKAEAERLRQAKIKADQEEQARRKAEEKSREKEIKDVNKKLKEQDKEEERARKAEERLAKKEKRKSKTAAAVRSDTEPAAATEAVPVVEAEDAPVAAVATEGEASATSPATGDEPGHEDLYRAPSPPTVDTAMASGGRTTTTVVAGKEPPSPTSPPGSPRSAGRVSSWLKTHLRRMSKNQKSSSSEAENGKGAEGGFIGGASLANASNVSLANGKSSVRDATPTGKAKERDGDSEVSALSNGDEEVFEEARDTLDDLQLPPKIEEPTSHSPVRDSRFVEEI